MSLTQRIRSVFTGLFSLLGAALLLLTNEEGYQLVTFLLGLTLIVYGLRTLLFYATMARHMVDGRGILYRGVLALDFGVFTLSAIEQSGVFLALYLLGVNAFSGAMASLRALEARRFQAPAWRIKLVQGLVDIGFAAAALVFGLVLGSMRQLTWIYASGLLYGGLLRIVSAFRKTAIVYIQ